MIQLRRYTISRFKRTVWQDNVPLPGNYINKRALAKGFTNLSDKAHDIAFFFQAEKNMCLVIHENQRVHIHLRLLASLKKDNQGIACLKEERPTYHYIFT